MTAEQEKNLEFLEQQIPDLAAAATKRAYWRHLSAGRSVLECIDNGLYETRPDGSRRLIRMLDEEPST
jgi:hypothetical protein